MRPVLAYLDLSGETGTLCTGLSNRTISTRPGGSRTSLDHRSAHQALAKVAASLSLISVVL